MSESERFHAAFAAGDHWSEVARACRAQLPEHFPEGDGELLGFVYVTDLIGSDFPSILTFLRETTGVTHWVGTVGLGICASGIRGGGKPGGDTKQTDAAPADPGECFDTPALAVMVAGFPQGAFRVFQTVSGDFKEFRGAHRKWLKQASSADGPVVGLVHGDPRNPDTPDILRGLARESAAFLVGGLSSSRGAFDQVADYPVHGGLSGVLFSGAVPVVTGLAQSCAPIGPVHAITGCQAENVITRLDGRPAFEVFAEELAREVSDDSGADPDDVPVSVVAGLPIPGSDTGEYLVRNLTGVDPEKGLIVIPERVSEGAPFMFCRRSRSHAESELRRMLRSLKRRTGTAPKGGVYIACVGRGPSLFGEEGVEINIVREEMGDFPLVGFFANGEISNDRLHGFTGVLALFL